jgi:hypothetical protein
MPIEWVIGVLVTVILALAGALYLHVKECREVRAAMATFAAQLTAIAREIGDHDTGLRGSMHRLREETRDAILRMDRK